MVSMADESPGVALSQDWKSCAQHSQFGVETLNKQVLQQYKEGTIELECSRSVTLQSIGET